MKQTQDFTTESKKPWVSTLGHLTDSQLQVGCLQRIATALEVLARASCVNHNLRCSVDRLEKSVKRYQKKVKELKSKQGV